MSSTPTISLCSVHVRNLRCHAEMVWECRPGMNLLTGRNGSGKTTMLEAVSLLVHGRSFRQARDPELVRWRERQFAVEGRWLRYGPIHSRAAGRRGKVELSLQGKKIASRRELFETLPVLIEAPQGARIVDGVPNERRRWLDALVQALQPGIARDYQAYLRAMMQRRRLLKQTTGSGECDGWEQQMVHYGRRITTARADVMARLNQLLGQEAELTEHPFCLELKTTVPADDDAWRQLLREHRARDLKLGRSLNGPHCDHLAMVYRDREIRSAGSRGQQKLAAIALRLAECAARGAQRQMTPVLLLDDCLEALDPERQQRLMQRLDRYPGQVLMTAPNGLEIPGGVSVHCFELKEDSIVPVAPAVPGSRLEKAA